MEEVIYLWYCCTDCGKRFSVHISEAKDRNGRKRIVDCPKCDGGNDPYDYYHPVHYVSLN